MSNLNILGSISELISGAENKLVGKFKLTRSGGMVVFEEGFEPLSTQIHDSIFGRLENKDSESFIIDDSGKKYLVGFSEIELTKGEKGYGFGGTFESIDHKKGNTGESWYVICYRQMNVVIAPIVASIKSIILIGSAMIVILVLVAYLIGRKIAQPLATLDKATEEIGKGDFEYRIDAGRNDEFGNLASSFNSMADKLQQTTTSVELLENEVEHRRQTEKALRESEEKYRNILESIGEGYYEVDLAGNFTFFNDAMCRIRGYSRDELMGMNNRGYMDPVTAKKIFEAYHQVYTTGKGMKGYEWETVRKDGTKGYVEVSASLMKNPEDKPIGFRGIVRDVTERKFAEEEKKHLEAQLQQAQKMEAIATLAGGVAHEFNNALMGIMGNIELLKMGLPEDGSRDKSFEAMRDSGHRMSRLTDQLLAYARGGKYEARDLKLDDFTIETLPILQHDLNPGVRVETHFEKSISYIKADSAQMQMVLSAILANSNEAIEGKGLIRIAAENKDIDEAFTKQHPGLKPGLYVCLTIEDDGKGMDEETKDGIFEPFFTTKFQGRGMGMAAVYGIIKGHDGAIVVDSEPGKGTVVCGPYLSPCHKRREQAGSKDS